MRLLIYMLMLSALIAILIKGLMLASATGLLGKDLLLREYELRRCGRFLAWQKNLHASVAIIKHYHRAQASKSNLEKLMTAITNFTANYKVERCMDAKLGLMVEAYKHDNPTLPDFWANYAFRFVSYQ